MTPTQCSGDFCRVLALLISLLLLCVYGCGPLRKLLWSVCCGNNHFTVISVADYTRTGSAPLQYWAGVFAEARQ